MAAVLAGAAAVRGLASAARTVRASRGLFSAQAAPRRHQRQQRRCAMASSSVQEPTIIECVVSDHRNVTAMMARCLTAAKEGDEELANALATAMTVDVLLHSRAEEAVLYPFLMKRLGEEGKHFTEHSNEEHAELEGKLLAATLAGREGDWGAMQTQMADAQKAFAHHMRDEEDKYLPKLEQATQPQELRELTGHWADAKRNARLEQLSGPLNKAAWSR